jgi:hypothetical protein
MHRNPNALSPESQALHLGNPAAVMAERDGVLVGMAVVMAGEDYGDSAFNFSGRMREIHHERKKRLRWSIASPLRTN